MTKPLPVTRAMMKNAAENGFTIRIKPDGEVVFELARDEPKRPQSSKPKLVRL